MIPASSPVLLYVVAGEISGDALGAHLMQQMREGVSQPLLFCGIGGSQMQAQGLSSLFPMEDLSIMGFLEVVPHLPKILRRLKQTCDDIRAKQPAAVITIDSPGYNFRLAAMLKKDPATRHIPRIHYVAPSVWAYKPERAAKTAKLFNLLLTLFPCEPAYFEKEGLKSLCVGHPALWNTTQGDTLSLRTRHGFNADNPILLVLPGSRRKEVDTHLPIFLDACTALPAYRPLVLCPVSFHAAIQKRYPGVALAEPHEKADAFSAAGLALSKSGTITLELAAAGVPAVVAHRVSPVSAWLFQKLALVRFVSLINIAADKEIYPELLQEQCSPKVIAKTLIRLSTPEAQATQKKHITYALQLLRGNALEAPGQRITQVLMNFLKLPDVQR